MYCLCTLRACSFEPDLPRHLAKSSDYIGHLRHTLRFAIRCSGSRFLCAGDMQAQCPEGSLAAVFGIWPRLRYVFAAAAVTLNSNHHTRPHCQSEFRLGSQNATVPCRRSVHSPGSGAADDVRRAAAGAPQLRRSRLAALGPRPRAGSRRSSRAWSRRSRSLRRTVPDKRNLFQWCSGVFQFNYVYSVAF